MTHTKAKVSTRRAVRASDATAPAVQSELELEREHGHRAKPISLHPLDFATAVRGLLAVKWPVRRKKKKKRSA